MPLTRPQKLARALAALRLLAERGSPDQQVPVRRWHLRVLLDAYDREVAENASVPVDDYPGRPPREAYEVVADAVGAPMRREPRPAGGEQP